MSKASIARIAFFDRYMTFHCDFSEEPAQDNLQDSPSDWAADFSDPEWVEASGVWKIKDKRTVKEVQRLMRFRTCAFCRTPMYEFPENFQSGTILLCRRCGYWGGHGQRDWGVHQTGPRRGVLGRYRSLKPLDDQNTDVLLTHLRRHPKDMPKISPRRAERFVADLLSDVLQCESRLVGGVKDGGVDAYLVGETRYVP